MVLVLLGLRFWSGLYRLMLMGKQEPALAMTRSLYVTLGIFLLCASRDPSAHGSLMAFTAWWSFAHAGVMSSQAMLHLIWRRQ